MACISNLKTKDPGAAVEDVLDFFDDAAFLVKKGALDTEMTWHAFYHWVRLYFQAAEQHIMAYRKREPPVWNYLCWIYPRLNGFEKTQRPSTYREKLDDEDLKRQLEEEIF